ncbi:MAG: hypothetical protein ABSA71_09325 [Desulfomonilia bacterium]|jgi:outer membrane protein OmpA-like peptidoglycan-associated protein
MKNSWLFILVFMIPGTEVILLYSEKIIIDKEDEDNPSIQQKAIQPILSAPTSKVNESALIKSATDEIKISDRNEIHFDFVMPTLEPDVPDILNQKLSFIKVHPDFKFWIKRNHGEGDTIGSKLTLGDRRARAFQNDLVHQGMKKERVSSISYVEVNHG